MRLTDLNPRLDGQFLILDCPCGKCGSGLRLPVGAEQSHSAAAPVWKMIGDFPDTISLHPSILVYPWRDAKLKGNEHFCQGWHGFIVNGEMKPC